MTLGDGPKRRVRDVYDVNTRWYDSEARDEVRAHHHEILRAKAESGRKGYKKWVNSVPHLESALQRLIDAGYSYTDIGVILGVPKHYIYRWCQHFDIDLSVKDVGGARYRVWSDTEHRFVPVDPDDFYGVLWEQYQIDTYRDRLRRHLQVRYDQVRRFQVFVRRHGRSPLVGELSEWIGLSIPAICYYWGYNDGHTDPIDPVVGCYYEAMNRLYDAAGYKRI